MRVSRMVSLCAGIVLMSGCATVPKEAVTLSMVVGSRLADMQTSHEKAVSSYFQLTRERIESFLESRWVPEFLGNFVEGADLTNRLAGVRPLTDDQQKNILAELDKAGIAKANQPAIVAAVNSAFGNPDRGRLILQFAEAAIAQIELKRKSLLDPVNAQEKQAMEQLRGAYAQLIQAQSVVTGHLNSVQKVTQAQNDALAQLGLLQKRDEVMNKAISVNDEVLGIINKGKSALDTVKDLEEKFKAQTAPAPAAAPAPAK